MLDSEGFPKAKFPMQGIFVSVCPPSFVGKGVPLGGQNILVTEAFKISAGGIPKGES